MKTLFVGQNSLHVESVDSTNSYATEMLRQIALPEGSLIYSFEQRNGRGQRGNAWESEPNKNVALSLVMHPKFLNVERQFLLTIITSLAVSDLMAELLLADIKPNEISIKWPNDIFVKEKKVAGILIENSLKDAQIQSSVIGVGINVNQEVFNSHNAVSLKMVSGREFDLMTVIGRLAELFEARYLQLRTGKTEDVRSEYLERLYRKGVWAEYMIQETVVEGCIKGVSQRGMLQVEMRNGVVEEFDLKEISFRANV